MLRIDSLATEYLSEKTLFSFEGVKGLFIKPGGPYNCAKSTDLSVMQICFNIRVIIYHLFSVADQQLKHRKISDG